MWWPFELLTSSGARKNDVNATLGTDAGNSSFCQVHAFKFGHLLQLIANWSFVRFICQNFIASQNMSSNIISWNFIYNAKGILKLWECYCSRPFAGNKRARSHSVFLPGARVHRRSSGHLTTCNNHNGDDVFLLMMITVITTYIVVFIIYLRFVWI